MVNGLCVNPIQVFKSSSLDAAGLVLANVFAALTVFRDTAPLDDMQLTGQVVVRSRGGDNPSGQRTIGGGSFAQGSDVGYTGPGTYVFPLMVARSHMAEAVEFVILCEHRSAGRVIEFTANGQIVAGIGRL